MKHVLIAVSNAISNEANGLSNNVGNQLAWLFRLKKDAVQKDHFKVNGGVESTSGVAKLFFRLLDEAGLKDDATLGNPKLKAGNLVAEAFRLKRDKEQPDKFQTAIGFKSVEALMDNAISIVTDEVDKLPHDQVIRSEVKQGFWSRSQGWVLEVASATLFNLLETRELEVLALIANDSQFMAASLAVDFGSDEGQRL